MLPRTAIAMLGIVLSLFAAAIFAPMPARGATHTVEIGDGFYSPASLTVAVGDTVTWANVDDSPHTVTASGAFDSGNLDAGQTFSFTFTEAGTFGYICSYHDEMTATITVAGASAAAATPVPSAAAAPAAPAPSHEAGAHAGEQPDTALPEPPSGAVMRWAAPLLIGVGLVAFAVGFMPERGAMVATSTARRRSRTGGWRR